jgi:hypothetical protein
VTRGWAQRGSGALTRLTPSQSSAWRGAVT